MSGAQNQTAGQFFDDYVQPVTFRVSALWRVNSSDELIAQNAGNVGVGVDTIDPAARLHVAGQVTGDRLHTDQICDDTGTLCMDPQIVGGNVFRVDDEGGADRPECPANQILVGIANNRGICATSDFTIPTGFSCPAGEGITALYSDGSPPDCAPLP